ncbi:leucine aminopeptidase 1 [Striga asiatica]|uniref:Leucine aminopeptidase 1 n=1 Tax=Striga asiatica TaxID=4170 RepID=A0A5A7R2R7_STRAF|nr:leucine aminopeptidase 1 [Striga asiatica]
MRNDAVAIYSSPRLPNVDAECEGEAAAQATESLFRTDLTGGKVLAGTMSAIPAVKEVAGTSSDGSTAATVLLILSQLGKITVGVIGKKPNFPKFHAYITCRNSFPPSTCLRLNTLQTTPKGTTVPKSKTE